MSTIKKLCQKYTVTKIKQKDIIISGSKVEVL